MAFDDIETPAVLIDAQKARANIARFQAYADQHGFALRPHIKTHKLPLFAKAQVAAGAIGINCQKLARPRVMADAGLTDILVTYNIIGAQKLKRLVALARRVGKLTVTADSVSVVDGLSAASRRKTGRFTCWSNAIPAAGGKGYRRRNRPLRSARRSPKRRASAFPD